MFDYSEDPENYSTIKWKPSPPYSNHPPVKSCDCRWCVMDNEEVKKEETFTFHWLTWDVEPDSDIRHLDWL